MKMLLVGLRAVVTVLNWFEPRVHIYPILSVCISQPFVNAFLVGIECEHSQSF